jgi:hypothetical protein
MDQLVIVLMLIALAAAGGVAIMRRLRPVQRAVVMTGMLAAAAQVLFPPYVEGGRDLPRRVEGRRLLDRRSSYSPCDIEPWIDADRQLAGLAATLIAASAACWLMSYLQPGPSVATNPADDS